MKTIAYDSELYLTLSKGKVVIRGVQGEEYEKDEKIREIKERNYERRQELDVNRTNTGICPEGGTDNGTGDTSGGANTTVVTGSNYIAQGSEFYIGVNSKEQSTIYLPATPADGKILIIKSEMTPPIGNRRITIKPSDGHTIDGYSELVIAVSHDCKRLLFRGDSWHIM